MKTIFQLITLIGVFAITGIPNHADKNPELAELLKAYKKLV